MNTSLQNLLTITFLFLIGNLLASGVIAVLALSEGIPLDQLSELSSDPSSIPESILRSMLWVQSVCVFIIPAIAYWLLRKDMGFLQFFDLDRRPSTTMLGLSLLLLIAAYPLVHASYVVNTLIPLPEWATSLEANAADILGTVLEMDSILSFITTLIIVAVLPAIGEELVFRGIVQREAGALVGSRTAGIWIAAFLFSLIHFQFEGFLPRFLLGAILGYIYHYSRTLWMPILVHFMNNGFQVTALYLTGTDLSAANDEDLKVTWWVVAISMIAFASLILLLQRQSTQEWTDKT